MRVRYFGDLHLEFTSMKPRRLRSVGEDLVVLAGDIASGMAGIEWAKRAFKDRPVVYVLGNHEFYGRDFDSLIRKARAISFGSNVHLLENDSFLIQGYKVLGCTLWTDFLLFGKEKVGRATAHASGYMPDYTEIRRSRRPLLVQDTIDRCRESYLWLDAEIRTSGQPLLVVTHHAPSLDTMNPRYAGLMSGAAFHNAFDELLRPPVCAWIHGHTHFSTTKMVNRIPLVTNQRGGPFEADSDFSWERMIQLPSSDLPDLSI